jgi:prophage tail gpP-like protein
MTDLILRVNGSDFSGWKSVQYTSSLDMICQDITLEHADLWLGVDQSTLNTISNAGVMPRPAQPGDSYQLIYNDTVLSTGYIDGDSISQDGTSRSYQLSGRSKSADICDCSALPQHYRNQDIVQLATALIQPYGLTIALSSGSQAGARFPSYIVEGTGATVAEEIEKAARMRGFLIQTKPDGNLLLTRESNTRSSTTLEYGVNILRSCRNTDHRERYSEITAISQTQGNDQYNGDNVTVIKKTLQDNSILRYRNTIFTSEQPETRAALTNRVNWKLNRSRGRSQRYTATVVGWTDNQGIVWQPNTIVPVYDPVSRIDDDLLLVTVRLDLNEQGQLAILEFCGLGAYSIEPFSPPRRRDGMTYL